MRSTLGEWNGVPIQSYGALYLASFLFSIGFLTILLKRRQQNLSPAVDLTLLMIVGYTVGAHALYALLDRSRSFAEWFTGERLSAGFWGGPIAFALLAVPYFCTSRVPMRQLGDSLAVAWAGVSVLQKIGCFLAGCCHGKPSSAPWAVVFPPEGLCSFPGQPIHPTQLYEAASALLIGLLLLVLYLRRAGEGKLLLVWGLLFGLAKFASEWFRGDARFPVVGPVTRSMIAEATVAVGAWLLLFYPVLWNRLVNWQETRAAAAGVPTEVISRGAAFGRGLLRYLLAVVLAGTAGGALAWMPAFYVVFFCVHLVLSAIGSVASLRVRLVDRAGKRAGMVRVGLHALGESVSGVSLLGLFRPLLDRHGRSIGDALAGLYRIRAQ